MLRYVGLFVSEAREHLEAAFELQARLERDPVEARSIDEYLRHVHSLKGMSGTLGFQAMVVLSHAMEDLLGRARRDTKGVGSRELPVLRDGLACLGRIVERVERGEPAHSDRAETLAAQMAVAGGFSPDATVPHDPPTRDPAAGLTAVEWLDYWRAEIQLGTESRSAERTVGLLRKIANLGRVIEASPPMLSLETGRFEGRLGLVIGSNHTGEELEGRIRGLAGVRSVKLEPARSPGRPCQPTARTRWIRVRADLLDRLVGDLLDLRREQARMQPLLPPRSASARQQLSRCEFRVKQIYGTAMALRLVPFDTVVGRLHGTVREVSSLLGKPVHFEIVGASVSLDRGVLDALLDPLMHAVKNALDHGLESAAERKAANKPPEGRLRLRLERRADRVTITLDDDGRGIRPETIKRRAVELRLIDAARAASMSDSEALMLTTLAAFTTSREVNHVSGRGVGLDVVRDTLENIGGTLAILSRPGQGTRIRMSLPPSQALLPTLIVRCAEERYALPIGDVLRTADSAPQELKLVRLDEHLGMRRTNAGGPPTALVVLGRGRPRVALGVDEVLGRHDVVVRPMSGLLAGLRQYSGAALMEDGAIALVLDPGAIGAGRGAA